MNLFIGSTALQFAISVIGVLVFAGLTAYDTQQIKEMYSVNDDGTVAGKKAVMGALRLYLDFINLFMMLLRFWATAAKRNAAFRSTKGPGIPPGPFSLLDAVVWDSAAPAYPRVEKWRIVSKSDVRGGHPSPSRGSPRTEPEKPRVPPSPGLLYCLLLEIVC